jgi:uncharacterized damage-inducible protein DinB
MITLPLARDLFRHMQWADAAMWRAIVATDGASTDERLMKIVLHLHAVQRFFLLMWRNIEADPQEIYSERSPAAMLEWARAYYPEAEAFLAADELQLESIVHMPWLQHFEEQLGRSLQSPTLSETLVQLPSHSTYHRGQVNLRLRDIGGEPPLVDYITWIWYSRPEPIWPTFDSAS